MNKKTETYSAFYLAYFAAILIFLFPAHSLWHFFGMLAFFLRPVTLLMSIVVLIISFKKYSDYLLLLVFLLILVLTNSFLSGKYYGEMLWHLFVLTIGAKGVAFKKIIKIHLLMEILLCVANIFAYKNGLTDKNLVFLQDQRENMFGGDVITRLSLGYPAATDFATHVFYILLDFWIINNGKLKLLGYFLYLSAIFFVVLYCDARQAAVCIFLIVVFSIYLSYKSWRGRVTINKWLAFFFKYSIPFLGILSIYLTVSYDETNFYWIAADIVLSGRLSFGYEGIQEFGINWLGQTVKMFGSGSAGVMDEYNYVDCSYVQFAIRWGILMMIIFALAFLKIGKDAIRSNNNVILCALFIAGISSVITQYLFFPDYCILILALWANHESFFFNHYENRNIIISS